MTVRCEMWLWVVRWTMGCDCVIWIVSVWCGLWQYVMTVRCEMWLWVVRWDCGMWLCDITCDLRRIRNTIDYCTAQIIATSLIQFKVNYCNSLFLNLSRCHLDRLQLILNSAARAVSKNPRFSPILISLHWLKIDQRIQYKVLSLTC